MIDVLDKAVNKALLMGVLVTSGSFGCAQRATCPDVPATARPSFDDGVVSALRPVEAPGELSVEQTLDEKLSATSPAVNLRVELDAAVIPAPRTAALIDQLKAALTKKGFTVTADGATSELTVGSFDQGKRRGLVLEWGLRRANHRPRRWFRQVFTVGEAFDAVWPKLVNSVGAALTALELPIRADPSQVANTCAPRFGFTADGRGVVTLVIVGSPAARAGLRAGDVIEGLDSRPLAPDRPDVDAEVYEKRVVVPLKFNRAGVIQRAQIRPELVCE